MKKTGIIIIVILIIIASIILAFLLRKDNNMNNKNSNNSNNSSQYNQYVGSNTDFDYKMIRETNNRYKNQNYMISPLSIAYALSMVNDGADGNTKDQISKVLNDYKLNGNINVKDKVGIANLIFIRNTFKKDISENYISILQSKYDSDVLFDDFKTPKAVNDWISKKTFNMLNDVVQNLSDDFVLGLANAIAIDVEWRDKFECYSTREDEFTKIDNSTMKTAMMHSSNDIDYIENDNAKGIIKEYAIYDKNTGKRVYEESDNTVALEYIAILPKSDINDYLNKFDNNELANLLSTKKEPNSNREIYLGLPKYTYDFTYSDFKEALINLEMTDAFNPSIANFNKMIESNSELKLFISSAIHKTHIELSENGTKAAAVTVLMADGALAYQEEKEKISIQFNKPFIYLIKEKNSDNIWFFGTVYEPMKWEDNDSSNCFRE